MFDRRLKKKQEEYEKVKKDLKKNVPIKEIIAEFNRTGQADRVLDEINQILNLTTEVGTGIYKAREIETGFYDKSIDIYALGIIFIEFLLDCNTNHEKVSKLAEIFKLIDSGVKTIPYILTNKHDEIIIKMLGKIPSSRPKINELLLYFSN